MIELCRALILDPKVDYEATVKIHCDGYPGL
jgi:hypothetical protein